MDLSFRDIVITDYDSTVRGLKALLLSHPYLAQLEPYVGMGECGFDVVDAVDDILRDARGEAFGPDGRVHFEDICDDVENWLERLVDFNNDAWNFGPGDAPPKVSWQRAVLLTRALLTQRGLLRLELDTSLGPTKRWSRGDYAPSHGPVRLAAMVQGPSKVTVEEWTWPDDDGPVPDRIVSRHRDAGARATKSFERVVANWAEESPE